MMSREELRQAIEEPAAKRVMYFEPHTLVDCLIDEVAQMPGALPLLSFTLSELYLRYLRSERAGERNNRAITQEDYKAIGGVMRSLTQRAEQEFNALVQENPDYASTIRHVMLRMVVIGETSLARRRVHLSELDYPEPKQIQVNQVIERFSAARLLVGGQDEAGKRYIEPAHDALIQGWQRILEWRKSGYEMLTLQRLLTPAAEEWKLHWLSLTQKQLPWQQRINLWRLYWERRMISLFLWHTNPRLEVLKSVPRSNNNWFTRLEAEFVQRSIYQQHKTRAIRWGVVSTTLCLIAGLVALFQSSDRLMIDASIAETQLEIAPLDGMLKTIEVAHRSRNSPVGRLMEWLGEPVIPPLSKAISVAREKNQLSHYKDHVTSVGYSPDGVTIVGTSNDGVVRVWDAQGRVHHFHKIQRTADLSFAISPTGDEIVTGSQDGLIRLWSIKGEIIRVFAGHEGPVTAVAFSPDGDQLLSGSIDKTVRLWHRNGKLLRTLVEHEDAVTSVAFSPNVDRIASGSADQTIRLWDMIGKQPSVPIRGHEGAILSIAFHPSGTKIASGSADATVRFWNFAGDQILEPLRGHDDAVRAIAFDPKGNTLISGSTDRTIRSWNLSGHPLNEPLRGHEDAVTSVAFNPDGNIIISGSEDNTIRLWDWEIENSSVFALNSQQKRLRDVTFSKDGHTVVSVDEENTIHLWKHHVDHDFGNYQIDEDYKPLSHNPFRNELALDELASSQITAIALSPDQEIIATGNQKGTLHFRDLAGRFLHRAGDADCHPCEPIESIAFSPDQNAIVSSNIGGEVQIWDRQGKLLKSSNNLQDKNDFAASVAFVEHKHGVNQIVIGTYRGNIYLWNWQNQPNPSPFPDKAHNAAITAIAADQNIIYTGSRDRTIRLWDFEGHPKSNPLRGHGAEVDAIAIEHQSGVIYSASSDGQVRRWDIQSQSQLEDACERLANHPILQEQPRVQRICERIVSGRTELQPLETISSPLEVLP
jgi:WD40 repeat protein